MATRVICDGCEQPIEGEAKKVGLAITREYCAGCAPAAERYIEERRTLHVAAAERFQTDLQSLQSEFVALKALPS